MAGRSGRRRVDHRSPLVDLEDVFADDEFVDAIASSPWGPTEPHPLVGSFAARHEAGSTRGGVQTADPLAELFETWRHELAVTPIPAPPAVPRAAVVVEQGPVPRRRSVRPALSIAAAIAASFICAATIGAKEATPNSALWGVAQVFWPERALSVQSRVNVNVALDQARSALRAGRSQDAQLALLRATVDLGKVDDVDGRVGMQQTLADLWVAAAQSNAASTPKPQRVAAVAESGGSPNDQASSAPSSAQSTVSPNTDSVLAALPAEAAAQASDAAGTGRLASSAVIAPSTDAGSSVDGAAVGIAAGRSAGTATSTPSLLEPSPSPSPTAPAVVDQPTAVLPPMSLPPPPGVTAQGPVDADTSEAVAADVTEQAPAPAPTPSNSVVDPTTPDALGQP